MCSGIESTCEVLLLAMNVGKGSVCAVVTLKLQ